MGNFYNPECSARGGGAMKGIRANCQTLPKFSNGMCPFCFPYRPRSSILSLNKNSEWNALDYSTLSDSDYRLYPADALGENVTHRTPGLICLSERISEKSLLARALDQKH
jgi:hypothetical protein